MKSQVCRTLYAGSEDPIFTTATPELTSVGDCATREDLGWELSVHWSLVWCGTPRPDTAHARCIHQMNAFRARGCAEWIQYREEKKNCYYVRPQETIGVFSQISQLKFGLFQMFTLSVTSKSYEDILSES